MIPSEARGADTPVELPEHDDFQRATFAKRIAETFITLKDPNSLVVGLYGKWGEGKSSVLNFIKSLLSTEPEKVIVITFNPWLFPDEAQLLRSFFVQLAQAVDEVIPPTEDKTLWNRLTGKADKPLHTRSESLAAMLTKYAGAFSYGGFNLEKTVSSFVAAPSIEKLRTRVEEKIRSSGRRVVIIVDDIDRLEKTQIQSVFRLVKLTANFKFTAYLLAFDEIMVARAIGEIFSSGTDSVTPDGYLAGQNFLEKIIQVPLRLPRASQQDLLTYCAKRVREALIDTDTELDSHEAQLTGNDKNWQRFGDVLRSGILPRLITPRLAIRYANAIRFSLPLLKNEANPVDLMLVEALNVFYPEIHQFVAASQDKFAGSLQGQSRTFNLGGNAESPELDKELTELFDRHYYTAESRQGVRNILSALFPRVDGQYNTWAGFESPNSGASEADLNRTQSVAAAPYFSRYFSYSVASGDVADREWTALLNSPPTDQATSLHNFISRLGVAVVLQKLDYLVPNLTADQCRALWSSVAQVSDVFGQEAGWMTLGRGGISQASQLLIKLLVSLQDEAERKLRIDTLINSGGTFDLAYELDQQLQLLCEREKKMDTFSDRSSIVPLFSEEKWAEVLTAAPQALLRRALREAGDKPLYETHATHASKLLLIIWPQINDRATVAEYIWKFLNIKPDDLHILLKVCSDRISVGNEPYHWGGLNKQKVALLIHTFGEQLYELGRSLLGSEVVERVDFEEFEEPTPLQRLRQFVYLFEHSMPTNNLAQ